MTPCTGPHRYRITSEQTARRVGAIVGTWQGFCLNCGEQGSGPIRQPVIRQEDRQEQKQKDEVTRYKRWLAESEDGSYADSL